MIVCLIKNTSGDFTNHNGYRLIALQPVQCLKYFNILLYVILKHIYRQTKMWSFNQTTCIYALAEINKYLKSRSTSVYVVFLDTSKSFSTKFVIEHYLDNLLLVMYVCIWL